MKRVVMWVLYLVALFAALADSRHKGYLSGFHDGALACSEAAR